MLIVLKGADFSANKIGNVVVPRESLDSTTTRILSNYTKSLSVDIQYAFDDLIVSLKANGIWNKVTHAYFPCLAGSVTESLYEGKGDTPLSGTTNAGTMITTGYVLENYGLKTRTWSSGDGYGITNPEYTYGIKTNSMFIASVSRKDATASLYTASLSGLIYLDVNARRFLMGGSSSGIQKVSTINPALNSYNVFIGNSKNPANSEATIGISLNGITTYTYSTIGTPYSNPNALRQEIGVATSGYGQYFYNTWPVAVQLMGNELTDSEVLTLNTLLTSFNNKIIMG